MKKSFIIILIVISLLFISACDKTPSMDSYEFEINSKVKFYDLMQDTDKITVLDGSELIDTSTLGERKVVIKYLVNDEPKYKTVKVNIVDTISPVISYTKKLTTTKGKKVNLLKDVKVTDNSKEKIKASIIGDYNFNKVGTYKLKYYAVDSSGNSTTKSFTLVVKNVTIKTSGFYVYKGKDAYEEIKFKSNKKVEEWYNFCPGTGCGAYIEYGTYSIKDNVITVKMTSYGDETGGGKLKKAFSFKCTIKTAKKIVCGKATYNWYSSLQ